MFIIRTRSTSYDTSTTKKYKECPYIFVIHSLKIMESDPSHECTPDPNSKLNQTSISADTK